VVAKEISLASNNAGVLAVRAGSNAAGFGALAEFLDQLARKIIQGANDINRHAMAVSKLTSNTLRTKNAQDQYVIATQKAHNAEFVSSLAANQHKITNKKRQEDEAIVSQTKRLGRCLEDLKQEIDVGKVLASMSLVEASQAGKDFTAQLSDNARNIGSAIQRIEVHVAKALSLLKKG